MENKYLIFVTNFCDDRKFFKNLFTLEEKSHIATGLEELKSAIENHCLYSGRFITAVANKNFILAAALADATNLAALGIYATYMYHYSNKNE